MTATKEEIITALQSLDTTVDTNWTDDGSPRMDVLTAKLGKDLTRKLVNEALPGFNRTPAPAGEAPPSQEAIEVHSIMAPPDDYAPDTEDTPISELAADLDLDDPTQDQPLTREQLRELMKARLNSAVDEITDCQRGIRDANAALIAAQKRHSRLTADYNRRFPPLTAASNIKRHLAAHQAMRAEAVEDGQGSSQIDRAMSQSKKRGWQRPIRPAPAVAA